ncbi:MAG: putative proline-rich transrane protein [Proteobacteria bacterium]|nr:putative proline-rich transrane protein [Pseudomonadota bacterium]
MKKPGPRQRWLILGALLLGTVAAAAFVDDDPVASEPTERLTRRKIPANIGTKADTVSLAQQQPDPEAAQVADTGNTEQAAETIDPFRSKSWYVAPPPPPPPEPVAPPLPFRYLGQLVEDGQTLVFIDHQGRNLTIKVGDQIDGRYAVEAVDGGKVVFVYLPLKQQQTLPIGAA